jgi:hypothetical protein
MNTCLSGYSTQSTNITAELRTPLIAGIAGVLACGLGYARRCLWLLAKAPCHPPGWCGDPLLLSTFWTLTRCCTDRLGGAGVRAKSVPTLLLLTTTYQFRHQHARQAMDAAGYNQ